MRYVYSDFEPIVGGTNEFTDTADWVLYWYWQTPCEASQREIERLWLAADTDAPAVTRQLAALLAADANVYDAPAIDRAYRFLADRVADDDIDIDQLADMAMGWANRLEALGDAQHSCALHLLDTLGVE